MKIKHPITQIIVLVMAASVIAVIANGFASRQRQLMLPGYYPNALKVPKRSAAPPAPIAATTTVAPAPAPIEIPATTTVAPAAPAPPPEKRSDRFQPVDPVDGKPKPDGGLKPAATSDPLARFTPHRDKAYVEINGDDVALLHQHGALFLDARRTSVYEEGHIAGARSFSVWEADIEDKVRALFDERGDPREQNLPIVIYCSGGACEDSHMLAEKLWGIEFNNVYVYKDGFPDWQKRGGAVRTGPNP